MRKEVNKDNQEVSLQEETSRHLMGASGLDECMMYMLFEKACARSSRASNLALRKSWPSGNVRIMVPSSPVPIHRHCVGLGSCGKKKKDYRCSSFSALPHCGIHLQSSSHHLEHCPYTPSDALRLNITGKFGHNHVGVSIRD